MQLHFVLALVALHTAQTAAHLADISGTPGIPLGLNKPPGFHPGIFSDEVAAEVAHFEAAAQAGVNRRRDTTSTTDVPTVGWGTFDQLLDHDDPARGTFSQRYWYSTQYWAGPGSPVVLINPGEQSATGFNRTYLTNQRSPGLFADTVDGAIVILEHRYFGGSSPYDEMTVANLQLLTLSNALRDMTYFAETFVPPFDPSGRSAPSRCPWVVAGGSYAGALAAWEAGPGGSQSTFWAYYATSGVVEAIGDFWQYFDMVRQATPANCSADLVAVASHVDHVLLNGSAAQKQGLKASFLLEDLADADFARAIANSAILYQQTQFYYVPNYGVSPYFTFCDYVENVWPGSNNTVPDCHGVGVTKALAGYAKWFSEVFLPTVCSQFGYKEFQDTYSTGCFAYLNASNPMYQDRSVSSLASWQYMWLTCNEPIGWFQDAAPAGYPSIVSRLVNYDYHMQICRNLFPESAGGFGLAHGKTTASTNAFTGGWSVPPARTPRLLYSNGELDPWRAATVSSAYRPGGPMASTENVPIFIVPGGGHVSDAYAENWAVNAGVKAVVDAEAAIVLNWINEFYEEKNLTKPGLE